MQTHTVTSYKFSELTEAAKEKARDWYREGALDYEWWESTYEDAANVGLKITGFDLGRGSELDAKFQRDPAEVARAIVKDHGEGCETRKDAEAFLAAIEGQDEPTEEQAEDFLRDLRHDYWIILEKEAEYLTSDECVDESIAANEYDFTADGRRFSGCV